MFTGLIEKIGTLKSRHKDQEGTVLTIEHALWEMPVQKGESIAVNGVCFTVTGVTEGTFTCDVLDETLSVTNFGTKEVGAKLNLERAIRVGDSIGGHFVSGHIDGVSRLVSISNAGRDKVLRFESGDNLLHDMVMKGSVACDGVSLTISALADSWFEVNVIPFTWTHTTLCNLRDGDTVNIETDMLGKYVRRSIETGQKSMHGLDFDNLRMAGFID
ncbi:MAG: riboflavin synthase [Kiritimatiellae bacterium]|nr:riboflavin synthase [Kiritimatiellia bacterium]MDD5521267.1 riboflavin synthase [Kiritimatiellia bacterium]